MVFMIVCILLYLMTSDLILLALKVNFHLGSMQKMKKVHVPCAYFVKHLQQNALK